MQLPKLLESTTISERHHYQWHRTGRLEEGGQRKSRHLQHAKDPVYQSSGRFRGNIERILTGVPPNAAQKNPAGFRTPRKKPKLSKASHPQQMPIFLETVRDVPALRAMIWALIVAMIPTSLVPPAPYHPRLPKTPPVVARGDESIPWLIEEIARYREEWRTELTAMYMERGYAKEEAEELALASITGNIAQDTINRLNAGELRDSVQALLVLQQWLAVLPEDGRTFFQEFDDTINAFIRNESHDAKFNEQQMTHLLENLTAEEQELLQRCMELRYDMDIRRMAHYAEKEFDVPDIFNDSINSPPEEEALIAQGLLNEALVKAMIEDPMAHRALLAHFAGNMSKFLSLRLMMDTSLSDEKLQAKYSKWAREHPNEQLDYAAYRRRIQSVMFSTMVEQGKFLTRQLDPEYDDHAGPITPEMQKHILHAARQETMLARRHLYLMLALKKDDPHKQLTKQEAAIFYSLSLPYAEPQTLREIQAALRTLHRWENALNRARLHTEKSKPKLSAPKEMEIPKGRSPIIGRKAFEEIMEKDPLP